MNFIQKAQDKQPKPAKPAATAFLHEFSSEKNSKDLHVSCD